MLLIDAIERRLRSLGLEPVRTFDAQERSWRLTAHGRTIATGQSIAELAEAADRWLTDTERRLSTL